jgi:hypothetical protein
MQPSSMACMQTTSVRIDVSTHRELKRLAEDLGSTVGQTVTIAVRRLRQDVIGRQLSAKLTEVESAWLDAELG